MFNNEFDFVKKNGVEYITAGNFAKVRGYRHFFSTRIGGRSEGEFDNLNLGIYTEDSADNIENNLQNIFKAAAMNCSNITYLKQIHSDMFYKVDECNYKDIRGKDGDALITTTKNIPVGVFTADCVPIIIGDVKGRVAAAVHAGWRGTFSNIAGRVINYIVENLGIEAEEVIAALGPAIGPCCFEVGKNVADKFKFVKTRNGKLFVDLFAENVEHIRKAGVLEKNIACSRLCTFCDSNRFYSYRRDNGRTGRLGTFIELY